MQTFAVIDTKHLEAVQNVRHWVLTVCRSWITGFSSRRSMLNILPKFAIYFGSREIQKEIRFEPSGRFLKVPDPLSFPAHQESQVVGGIARGGPVSRGACASGHRAREGSPRFQGKDVQRLTCARTSEKKEYLS